MQSLVFNVYQLSQHFWARDSIRRLISNWFLYGESGLDITQTGVHRFPQVLYDDIPMPVKGLVECHRQAMADVIAILRSHRYHRRTGPLKHG